jgi:hypothetical protein
MKRLLPLLALCALAWFPAGGDGTCLAAPAEEPQAAATAEEPQQEPSVPDPGARDADEGIHPDAVSSFQVRSYKTSVKKLWKGLLQVLQQAGYPPEEVNEREKRVKTSFVDFKSSDYSEEVGDPPPRVGANYHILQMNKVKEGKVSLEGVVTKGDKGGAVLSLRARILVQGLDQVKRIRVLTDRRSSGVIESDFLQRLEDTLHLERI